MGLVVVVVKHSQNHMRTVSPYAEGQYAVFQEVVQCWSALPVAFLPEVLTATWLQWSVTLRPVSMVQHAPAVRAEP